MDEEAQMDELTKLNELQKSESTAEEKDDTRKETIPERETSDTSQDQRHTPFRKQVSVFFLSLFDPLLCNSHRKIFPFNLFPRRLKSVRIYFINFNYKP